MNYGMNLRVLLEGWLQDIPPVAISGITQDPLRAGPGCALVVSPLERRPSREALTDAVEGGCAVIIHDDDHELTGMNVEVLRVPRLAERLGELASRFWAAPSDLMTVAAITGDTGRSPVSGFLSQVWQRSGAAGASTERRCPGPMDALQPAGRSAADVFSLNQALAACIDSGIDCVAVDVSAEALRNGRCQTLQVDLAMIMQVGACHGGEYDERRLLTDFFPRFSMLNMDDPVARRWARELSNDRELLGFGSDPRAELSLRVPSMDASGMTLELLGPWGHGRIRTELTGREHALRLLAAAGALTLLGMDWCDSCRQLEDLRPIGRPALTEQPGNVQIALEQAA